MNKKGFTLIELLVSLTIIALVTAIAGTSIVLINNSSKNRIYESKKDIILIAATQYGNDHKSSLFASNDEVEITMEILLQTGYLEPDIENGKIIQKQEICQKTYGCIINPVDNSVMNDNKITLVFFQNRVYTELDKDNIYANLNVNIKINAKNASTEKSNYRISYNTNKEIKITPKEGYIIKDASITCTNNVGATLDEGTSKLLLSNTKQDATCTITLSKKYLASANVGDYVNYVGTNDCVGDSCKGCNAVTTTPGSQCNTTGGYCYSSSYKTNAYGWRIAYIEKNNDGYDDDVVYLISGGTPECLTGTSSNSATTINNQNNIALKYCNKNYTYDKKCDSTTAFALNESMFQNINRNTSTLLNCKATSSAACGNTNSLLTINDSYWFATSINTESTYYWLGRTNNYTNYSAANITAGVRPIIKLYPGILTNSGTGTQENLYSLVEPSHENVIFINVNNGTSASSKVVISNGGSKDIQITSKTGFNLTGSTVTCTDSIEALINTTTGILSLNNVTASGTCTVNITHGYLSAANVGDYVNYVGTNDCVGDSCKGCNAVTTTPGSQCNTTGGYCYSSSYKTNAYGWRIAYIEKNNDGYDDDVVYLISGGTPECLTGTSSNSATTINNQNNIALKYCNKNYTYDKKCDSTTAFALNESMFQNINRNTSTLLNCKATSSAACGNTNSLLTINDSYWFATSINTESTYYWLGRTNNYTNYSAANITAGVRPIIKLYSGIKTEGGVGTQGSSFDIVSQ